MSDETPYAPLGVDPEWLNSSCCLFVQRITFPNEQIENIWTPDSVYIYTMCIYIYTYEGTQNAIIIWNPLSIVGNRVEAVENQH